jgi:hypothetical protein
MTPMRELCGGLAVQTPSKNSMRILYLACAMNSYLFIHIRKRSHSVYGAEFIDQLGFQCICCARLADPPLDCKSSPVREMPQHPTTTVTNWLTVRKVNELLDSLTKSSRTTSLAYVHDTNVLHPIGGKLDPGIRRVNALKPARSAFPKEGWWYRILHALSAHRCIAIHKASIQYGGTKGQRYLFHLSAHA